MDHFCECGCGGKTTMIKKTVKRKGLVKGEYYRFMLHHAYKDNNKRFWAKVNKENDCWLWMGAKSNDGYGWMRYDHQMIRVHRLSWKLAFGDIPDGLWVLHKCDVPLCVNPTHLFLGTCVDNSADMVSKGRARNCAMRGENSPAAKLREKQVIEIMKLAPKKTVSYSNIALKYGISVSTVSAIVNRRSWKHLLAPVDN